MSSIRNRLHSTGKLEQLWFLVGGLGTVSFVSAAALLLVIVLEALLHGSVVGRTVLAGAWLVGTVACAVVFLSKPVLRLLGLASIDSVETLALRVGEVYPDVRDTLSNSLQLESTQHGSRELVSAAVLDAQTVASPKDFTAIINKKKHRLGLLRGLASIGLLVLLIGLLPQSLGSALQRLWNYDVSYMPPAPFRLAIRVMADTVMRGENGQVQISAIGTIPTGTQLFVRDVRSERFVPVAIEFDTSKTIVHEFQGMSSSVVLFAHAPWNESGVSTDTVGITVIDKPLIRSLTGRVVPPSYTGQAPTEISDQTADIATLRGSVASIRVIASKELHHARIIVESDADTGSADTTVVPMTVSGTQATANFSVKQSGAYHIEIVDKDRQSNANPVKHKIIALTDAYPTISMVEPQKDVDIDASARLPLLVAVADDYGFSSLRLKYKLVKSRYAAADKDYREIRIPIQQGVTSTDVGYVWDLAKVDITPDDEYEFYVEVFDNDVVSGPKSARSSTYHVRMPSLAEVYAQADRTQESLTKELKEIAKETEQIRRESEELQKELQKQQSQGKTQSQWSERKKTEDLAKRQQQLEKRMEEAAAKLEQMTEKLEQHQAISPETLEKYKELQELMKKVKSPELERMQRQMQEAMKQVSPEELEKMMQNFKFDEEKFKQNIERTMNLLKRIQAEQKADELAKRAEELMQQQEDLRKQTENTNAQSKEAREQLAKQQQNLKDELNKLAQESKELQQQMKDLGATMPNDLMERALEELDAEQTAADMQQAEQQMSSADMQKAAEKQKSASANLQRFAQQMKQVKKQMNKNANREAMRQMQRGMNDMLDLSKQQEDLMKQMENASPGTQQFNRLAQKQQQVQEAMKNMANSMMQLSQKSMSVTPEMAQDMGDALQHMQNALSQMQDGQSRMSMQSQQGAMSSMNSAAKRMSDALSQMMQGDGSGQGGDGQNPGQGKGSGQSPFQRLQQLADQQQQINQQMGQMGQNPGGSGQGAGSNGSQPTQEQLAEYGRLAQQQGRALKALQELERETREAGGTRKPIGNLDQIASDMKEVMTDMQTGSITPETKLRQERILSRLLNASRSMNERDYEKTRESNSGVDVTRQSPAALLNRSQDPAAMRTLMDQLKRGYTKDYESLIRAYFEVLQRQRTGVNN